MIKRPYNNEIPATRRKGGDSCFGVDRLRHVRYKDKRKITAEIRGETAVFERSKPWNQVYSAIAGLYANAVFSC